MEKKLIALQGRSGVGKSTSLHLLYQLLIAEPSNKLIYFEPIGRLLDFEAIVLVGNFNVGLVNRGDAPEVLEPYLRKFVNRGCDVIVCTARTKGLVNSLLASFSPEYEVHKVPKKPNLNASELISNLCSAHYLAARIYEAIDA